MPKGKATNHGEPAPGPHIITVPLTAHWWTRGRTARPPIALLGLMQGGEGAQRVCETDRRGAWLTFDRHAASPPNNDEPQWGVWKALGHLLKERPGKLTVETWGKTMEGGWGLAFKQETDVHPSWTTAR